jgi:hypothetical protein
MTLRNQQAASLQNFPFRALIEWRLTRDDIREIHAPILADIAELRSAVDSLETAFHTEKDLLNGTGPTSKDSSKLSRDQKKPGD